MNKKFFLLLITAGIGVGIYILFFLLSLLAYVTYNFVADLLKLNTIDFTAAKIFVLVSMIAMQEVGEFINKEE